MNNALRYNKELNQLYGELDIIPNIGLDRNELNKLIEYPIIER